MTLDLAVAIDVFNEIKSTSSRNDKEAILIKNKEHKLFRFMLDFLYNPYKITGLGFKKSVKFASYTGTDVPQFNDLYEAVDYLLKNNTGRDEDAKAINNFTNKFIDKVIDFLQEFFTKDIKIGITANTINKVYGKNTIPKFDIMLAENYFDYEHKVTGEFALTEKLDGVRCIVRKENGIIQFFTRKGHPIVGMELLIEDFDKLDDNFIYDGELLINKDLPSKELRKETSGLVRKEIQNKDVIFNMFDLLPVNEFDDGKSSKTYKVRMKDKKILFNAHKLDRIKNVEILYIGKDISVIEPLLEKMKSIEKEGVMLNNTNAYYVAKRNTNLLKVKTFIEVDLQIINYKEGKGKYKGILGSFIVDYKGFQLEVGSGYSDEQRKDFWDNKLEMIGKIITVQYHEETSNDKGGLSVSFPVFVMARDDKDEPSYH